GILRSPRSYRSLQQAESYSESCAYGGSIEISVSEDTNFELVVQFNKCRMTDPANELNGVLRLFGTESNFTATIGSEAEPFTSRWEEDGGYFEYALKFEYSNFFVKENGFETEVTIGGYLFVDYGDHGNLKVTYKDFVEHLNVDTRTSTIAAKQNGRIFEEGNLVNSGMGNVVVEATLTDFNITIAESDQNVIVYVDGTADVTFQPSNTCAGGFYTYRTERPLKYSKALDRVIDGLFYVNEARVEFNSDGSITVKASGYEHRYRGTDISGVCYF
ncbi:MAG: hypothetical protein ABIM21_07955, partial [candidate division WOR-3 bacterium]